MKERLEATIELQGSGTDLVPETILGYNLEVTEKNVRGMLSNRLENAKFVGPEDANGYAPPWRASVDFYQAQRDAIDPGISLAGAGSSQLLHSYSEVYAESFINQAMLQTEREVRAGEELEIVIWAKTRHKTTTMELAIRPAALPTEAYDSARIEVATPYWSRYSVVLKVPVDDPHAVFYCGLVERGLVWIDQILLRRAGEGHVSEEVIERLERLRVPVLRFPGGCLPSNYRWRHGTGPVEHRPALFDTANIRNQNYDFGTDEYLELCFAQGIRPHITVNIGTGTPDEAGEWANYIAEFYREKGVEPPVAYFQIGNEEWGIHEHSNLTSQMYVEVLRAYAPKIRAGHPSARLIAVAEKTGATLTEMATPWREVVLPVAKELEIEVLVVHNYCFGRFEDEGEQLAHAIESVETSAEELAELVADCREAGLTSSIGVTEWNYWTEAAHWDGPKAYERSGATMYEPYTASHAVYAAGMVHTYARLVPDFELAEFYHLINGMGVLTRRGIEVKDSPIAAFFELYRPALPGRRIDLALGGAEGGKSKTIDMLALESEEGRWLFVVNRSMDAVLSTRVNGVDGDPAEIVALGGGRPRDPIAAAEAPAWEDGGLEIPPLTIVRLRWGS
jgi:alpha-L-arabinofuranosidase